MVVVPLCSFTGNLFTGNGSRWSSQWLPCPEVNWVHVGDNGLDYTYSPIKWVDKSCRPQIRAQGSPLRWKLVPTLDQPRSHHPELAPLLDQPRNNHQKPTPTLDQPRDHDPGWRPCGEYALAPAEHRLPFIRTRPTTAEGAPESRTERGTFACRDRLWERSGDTAWSGGFFYCAHLH